MTFQSLGPQLDSLLTMPGVTDILVNGYQQVWVQRSSRSLESVVSPFQSEGQLAALAQQIIGLGGRHVDQANPFADVVIDGIRVHAAIGSVCNPKTHLSIRIHRERLFGLDQLADFGMFGLRELGFFRQMLAARQNFLIAGPTGSGKTTLLRALLAECVAERVIALEDVAEIGLPTPNFVSLQTRQANIEGKGEVNLDRLVREALRMRPDRLAIGEVRGIELLTLLQAMNTGHSGAGATIHANSLADVPSRLQSIVSASGLAGGAASTLDREGFAQSVQSAFSWVIQVNSRVVSAIGSFFIDASGNLKVVTRDF
ncbi:CpaF family protein [Rhodoluna limnophila]|uniref:CpaF family protein n=1 Tax=Rhodoluna limnophila TaxID=232537 RepID=UPI00110602AB|nr:ATPase, T2SS/T4P/T4SS family [Rhodoluna limnophila]